GPVGLVVRSYPLDPRISGSKLDSTEDPPCIGPPACYPIRRGAKRLPAGVVRKFEEEVPAQVSSSSSDLGSK
ncbi:hypothetical protein AVEN_75734-1, partial [Araneus ventricosus]